MTKQQKSRSAFPGVVALGLLILIVAIGALIGDKGKDDQTGTAAGIAYLESLEQKDPEAVMQVRQQIYQAKIDAQRDQLIHQLANGTLDPFSMFKDFVLMGDSRAVGFWYRDFLEKDRVIADGGHTIRDIITNMDKLVELNPSVIFLCYGLNDSSIGYWDTAEDYVTEYMETVKKIQERLPDATIVVSSILPAKDPAFQKSAKWRNIPQWSAALEKACKANNIPFANCDQLAEDHPNLWDPDGIHFREDFYPYWASCLAQAMLMGGAA